MSEDVVMILRLARKTPDLRNFFSDFKGSMAFRCSGFSHG